MVRLLATGVYQNKDGKTPERKVADIEKNGATPTFVIDGEALAHYVLSSKDKEHSWEFANGGDYNSYAQKIGEFFQLLKKFDATSIIVLPLPEGSLPTNEKNNQAWQNKTQEKLRRVTRVRQLLEKSNATSRNLQDVLPPFMVDEIAQTAAKLKIEVLFTRNFVQRFCASLVASKKADAVIGDDINYVLFPQCRYIAIDSFYNDVNNNWMCDYMSKESVAAILDLPDPETLMDLNILLGDEFTNKFVNVKYSVQTLLRIKQRPNNETYLVDGIVDWLSQDNYEGLESSQQFKDLIANDAEFKEAIDDCRKFYSLEDLAPEGNSEIRKAVDEGKLPLWALGLSEGGDFWYDPVVDDYKHEVSTLKVTLPIRKIIYGILGRADVVEHTPIDETMAFDMIKGEENLPTLAQIAKMKKVNLEKTFYNIAHGSFPKPPNYKEDPINKIEEPVKTIALALRYIIAQCFTENQSEATKTPADNTKLKEEGVIGAPPIDMFELRALAAQALCLMMLPYNQFQAPEFKPNLRRMHVSALYQVVLQHMLWLQQVFGQKSDLIKPHRIFDGQIFAAAYDCQGKIGGERFAPYYAEPEKVAELEDKRLEAFLKAVLYPFPEDLFTAFESVPRSQRLTGGSKAEEQLEVIEKHKSAFAGLMDDSEEDGDIELPPAPVINAPPPPPPAAKPVEEKKKPEMDEDEEMAFLMAAAAANKGAKREVKAAPAPKKPTNKSAPKKHVDKAAINQVNNFNKESKLDAKRQTKSGGHDWHRGEKSMF